MKKNIQQLVLATISILGAIACQKDKDDFGYDGTYLESGSAIVVNEGTFGNPSATASFISKNGQVFNNIYGAINNGAILGDVFQSYFVVGTKGICILNNSKKIELVDARNFKNIGTIIDADNITYPRYAVATDTSTLYVSNGSTTGNVLVINLTTKTVTNSISVGNGPEQMLIHNNNLYVANSGGFGVDSTVSVVNLATITETQKIVVGAIPTKMVKDANNNIWVLCKGESDFSNWPTITKLSATKIVRINTSNNTVDKSFTIIGVGNEGDASNLTIGQNGQTIYYNIDDVIYTFPINATSLPNTIFTSGRDFYGFNAHPFNGQLYACKAPNFISSGYVFRFNSNGTLIDSLQVGIAPNAVIFNP